MRRALPLLLVLLLCACSPAGATDPGYDTPWYRTFPTPTPTPAPTPSPTPSAAAGTAAYTPPPSAMPLSVETDDFVWTLPAGYARRTAADGQRVFETESGQQLLYTALDAETAGTALALPLSLLSAAVTERIGDGEFLFSDSGETLLAGRDAMHLTGTRQGGGLTLAVRVYAVTAGDTCHIFVLSWPDGGEEPAGALDALIWQ